MDKHPLSLRIKRNSRDSGRRRRSASSRKPEGIRSVVSNHPSLPSYRSDPSLSRGNGKTYVDVTRTDGAARCSRNERERRLDSTPGNTIYTGRSRFTRNKFRCAPLDPYSPWSEIENRLLLSWPDPEKTPRSSRKSFPSSLPVVVISAEVVSRSSEKLVMRTESLYVRVSL